MNKRSWKKEPFNSITCTHVKSAKVQLKGRLQCQAATPPRPPLQAPAINLRTAPTRKGPLPLGWAAPGVVPITALKTMTAACQEGLVGVSPACRHWLENGNGWGWWPEMSEEAETEEPRGSLRIIPPRVGDPPRRWVYLIENVWVRLDVEAGNPKFAAWLVSR